MRLRSVLAQHQKPKTLAFGLAGIAFAAALALAVVHRADAVGMTFVVDQDGMATNSNCNSSTPTPYTTVSAAVAAAAAGDTVKVCPGTYTEDVTVDKALTLKGAQYNQWVGGRTFGDTDESTISGLVTINAADVKLNGFSLTNPGEALGVDIKVAGDNAVVKRNIIKTVGSNTLTEPSVGVYLELGPDNVTVAGNAISDVQSLSKSAQGILVGDSTSANPSVDVKLDNNRISDITSGSRGAYGIQLNNGSNSDPSSTGYTEAKIRGNKIQNLNGNWVHAIGLEGETPNVVVDNNTISNLTASTPNVVGVFFEDNQFFFTGEVNQNSLAVGADNYGIAVEPTLASHYASLSVDGTCNWWGAFNGPGTVGTGLGAKVSAGVDFQPWLHGSNINRDCNDGFDHDGHHHSHHDWGNRDDSDWRHDD